jgi:anti-sigma factor RsiW
VNCKRTRKRLSAYLDGELAPGEEARVREHLASCRRCAAELDGLERLNAALGALEEATVPADFARRVRRAAARPTTRPSEPIPLGRWAAGRALTRVAALLMAAAGIGVGMALGGSLPRANGPSAQAATAETSAFDFPTDALSAAPAGSVADLYLESLGEAR